MHPIPSPFGVSRRQLTATKFTTVFILSGMIFSPTLYRGCTQAYIINKLIQQEEEEEHLCGSTEES